LGSALGRLCSSGFFALHDTRTPLRISIVRVVLSTAMGFPLALYGPRALGLAPQWGAAALALSSSVAGWVEFGLLRNRLSSRIGSARLPIKYVLTLALSAAFAGAAGFGLKLAFAGTHRIILAVVALGAFGVVYFLSTWLLGVPEASGLLRRIRERASRV
ncbi:MAG: lipid II flippase MurJ, partial [Gemmatimonadaceae bacterium]